MSLDFTIETLINYPDNGKHQFIKCDYPFNISKGHDGFFYTDHTGLEKKYNMSKGNKIDDRWILFLKKKASPSLKKIFKIKVNKDLGKVLEYCEKMYISSLKMEIKRLTAELKELT